jgi:hypothetical protein
VAPGKSIADEPSPGFVIHRRMNAPIDSMSFSKPVKSFIASPGAGRLKPPNLIGPPDVDFLISASHIWLAFPSRVHFI